MRRGGASGKESIDRLGRNSLRGRDASTLRTLRGWSSDEQVKRSRAEAGVGGGT